MLGMGLCRCFGSNLGMAHDLPTAGDRILLFTPGNLSLVLQGLRTLDFRKVNYKPGRYLIGCGGRVHTIWEQCIWKRAICAKRKICWKKRFAAIWRQRLAARLVPIMRCISLPRKRGLITRRRLQEASCLHQGTLKICSAWANQRITSRKDTSFTDSALGCGHVRLVFGR